MDAKITDVCFFVEDVARSIAFYQGKLGLDIKRRDTGFAEFLTGDATFALWEVQDIRKNLGEDILTPEGHWCIAAFEFQSASDVEACYAEWKDKGVPFVTDLIDWPWGARAAYFKDPDGFLWEIYAWVGTPYTW